MYIHMWHIQKGYFKVCIGDKRIKEDKIVKGRGRRRVREVRRQDNVGNQTYVVILRTKLQKNRH